MNRLKALLKELDFGDCCPLISFEEGKWYLDGDTIYWNTDHNLVDLYSQDANTYSGYMPEGHSIKDGYLITNIDAQTGCWVTQFFNLKDKVELEDLEAIYGNN